jgi:hypothetical protein
MIVRFLREIHVFSKIFLSIFAFPRLAGEGGAQRRMRASFRHANENFTHTPA